MNAKIIIPFLLALAIAAFVFVFRSMEQTADPGNPANHSEQGFIQLRFGHNINEESALHAAARRFAEMVEDRSKGRVRVSLHPNQELGNDHQMLEMARNGELDILLTPTAKLSPSIPAMQYADLPFYFSSREELYEMLDGEPGRMLLDQLGQIGLVGVTFWENGFKHFTANRPLLKPEDFQGLRFRTMKSPLIMEQFNVLGSKPIAIDFHATRQALADGVVDGQENPLVAIVGMKFHEVQSHLILSSHAYLGYVFSISGKVFQGLPADIQSMLMTTARELTAWEREETRQREEQFIATIREAGVKIYSLPLEVQREFSQKLEVIPRQFENEIGVGLLAKTEEIRWHKRYAGAADSDQRLLIGLDLDLHSHEKVASTAIRRGVELAVEDINNRGGVLGRPLGVLVRDNMNSVDRGVDNIRFFADIDNLVAVVACKKSPVVLGEVDTVHELGLPLLVPWAAATGITENGHEPNFVFRISASDYFTAPFLLEQASEGGRTVGLLLEDNAWGHSFHKAIESARVYDRPRPVVVHWIKRGDEGLVAAVEALERDGVEAIVLVANPKESARVVEAVAGMKQPVPIFAHWGLTGGNFWSLAGQYLNKVDLRFVQTGSLLEPVGNVQTRRLARVYTESYRHDESGVLFATSGILQAYDVVQMLALAVEQAGVVDRRAIRDAMEKLPRYLGVIKDYAPPFTLGHHDALHQKDLYLARYDEKGRIRRLTPAQ